MNAPRLKQTARLVSRMAIAASSALILGFAAACSSDTIAAPPAAAPELTPAQLKLGDIAKLLGLPLTPAIGLERTTALAAPVSKSALIGRNGGKIELKDLGLTVTVPSGAITGASINITVTAVAGKVVAYEFEPHGTVFAKALQFEQSTKNTTWDRRKYKGVLAGGYFQNLDQLNPNGLIALLTETYPVFVDGDKVSFGIWHFSGYMVSTGRSESSSEAF